MLVSERLRGLVFLMSEAVSGSWSSISPLTRRMMALGIISEMRVTIEQLDALNQKLDIELSTEDADIDFDLWNEIGENVQPLFHSSSYVTSKEVDITINMMPDLFPLVKSTTFKETSIESLKTGMRQLCSESSLNHADIAKSLKEGFGNIAYLLSQIKEKMTDIPDELYENYCDGFFARDLDLAFQQAERDYLAWKDDHEWKSQQALEDKRTQEVVKLLLGGVMSKSSPPTNREINECCVKISNDALEHNMILPDNIDVECARLGKYIIMKDCIMLFDYAKLGKYLYKHYKELSFEEELSLKIFNVTLDFIHEDMANLNPGLKVYLPDYEYNQRQAILENAQSIINTCKIYLNNNNQDTFLIDYLNDAFYGEIKQEVQRLLGRKAIYTNICKMLGMLKASTKVFKVGTTSDQLAACLNVLTDKPNRDSMKRKIDEGAADKSSKLRNWTDNYVRIKCMTESERLFTEISDS